MTDAVGSGGRIIPMDPSPSLSAVTWMDREFPQSRRVSGTFRLHFIAITLRLMSLKRKCQTVAFQVAQAEGF